MRIEYFKNVITVYMTDGLTQQPRYELCLRTENLFLPRNGFFGVSAATGGLADDHDITDFSVYSLYTETQRPVNPNPIPLDEIKKYDAEFEKQKQDFEKEKEKFREKHPEKAKADEDEELAKYFEDATVRRYKKYREFLVRTLVFNTLYSKNFQTLKYDKIICKNTRVKQCD